MSPWVRLWWWLAARLKSILQRIPGANRSFLVLSSGRSGSTLLMQYMRCHPAIACSFDEPLNPDNLDRNGLTRASMDPPTLIRYLMTQLLPLKPWIPYKGCKIFCEQLEFFRLPFGELLAALGDPPVIVLYRESTLETFVSLQIAFKTDLWYSQEESRMCCRVEVDFDHYKGYAESERERWRRTLSTLPRKNVYFLSYEELSGDKDVSLAGVFSFLRLPQYSGAVAFSKKQNPFSLAQKVSNFAEVQEMMKTFPDHNLTRKWMEESLGGP